MLEASNCYRFEELSYPKGLLDNSVDATYIIHLEGNGRLDHIKEQLQIYQPTKIVYILYNKGFKNCDKQLIKNISYIDLIDAFLYILKDADHKKYNNILILEDDFIFTDRIKQPNILDNINNFINKRADESFIYLLGNLPFLLIPYDYYNYYVYGIGAHACIYSKKTRQIILKNKDIGIINTDWDTYLNKSFTRYTYYEPLCYQLLTETENSKNWFNTFYQTTIIRKIIKKLKLDEQIEPGYSTMYKIAKINGIILIVLLLFIIYVIYKVINNYILNKSLLQ
jgi:hypothetical protein